MSDLPPPTLTEQQEFLRADFEHLAAALLQNEELGEKRVTFFTTLVATVSGGIGFLATQKDVTVHDLYRAVAIVSVVLFVIGVLTLRRLHRRNRVTDRYKLILSRLRKRGGGDLTEDYRDALDPKVQLPLLAGETEPKPRRFWDGGHAWIMLMLMGGLGVVLVCSTVRFFWPHSGDSTIPEQGCQKCCQECPK